jgi:hypothetical protein
LEAVARSKRRPEERNAHLSIASCKKILLGFVKHVAIFVKSRE